MPEIVGVRFKQAGKIYFFDPAGLDLEVDDRIVVDTSRGLEIGRVVVAPKQVVESQISEPLKPVVRKAAEEDLRQVGAWHAKEADALRTCQARVAQHNLPMKVLSAEYSYDGGRLTFFFNADGRVDFRDLLRELASAFRTRIELKQVGVRDKAKMLGGIGRCGRELCCSSHLCDFSTVTMKMAKEQNLPLNPMKISGLCGRLLCCLSYEADQYSELKQKLPRVGEWVTTSGGQGKVVSANLLKETLMVEMETGAVVETAAADILKRGGKPEQPPAPKT
ncbi:MAG: stage 0 sporulation family protein [Dehalococcoidia bacterium]|nr:stage 0 sporulation family protein [Dehalococcoidia bacterium]